MGIVLILISGHLLHVFISLPEPLGSWVSVQYRQALSSSNVFSETTGPFKAIFCMEPQWIEGMKVCSQHLGHITKVASLPLYGKNPIKIFSETKGPMALGLGMQH